MTHCAERRYGDVSWDMGILARACITRQSSCQQFLAVAGSLLQLLLLLLVQLLGLGSEGLSPRGTGTGIIILVCL